VKLNNIQVLRDEYIGVINWRKFVSAIEYYWIDFEKKDDVLALTKDIELAKAMAYQLGDAATIWFESPIPALDNHTPRYVFFKMSDGADILRSMLTRMD
jgi:hypothetical protein